LKGGQERRRRRRRGRRGRRRKRRVDIKGRRGALIMITTCPGH